MASLKKQLKFEEGLRLNTYKCTAGHWTIGYGHNLDSNPNGPRGNKIGETITEDEAEELLAFDMSRITQTLWIRWPDLNKLDPARRDACINMAFQLGINGFMKFKKMRQALTNRDWVAAYKEALNSNWAVQTPYRAHRVASQILNGKYYGVPE